MDGQNTIGGMGRFDHGGDVYTHEGVLDFSASLNPLGMPEAVKEALRVSIDRWDAYPDPECRALTAALARVHGVDEPQVLVTAGATDLMSRVCLALTPRLALVTAPCYSGYEKAFERVGAFSEQSSASASPPAPFQLLRHQLREDEGFAFTERILDDIVPGVEMVFLANPNNPTGRTIGPILLERILERCVEAGARLVIDECFIDFTEAESAIPLVEKFPNLIVMRAFTKLFALAGLRLGYGVCADKALMARLREVGQTWAVSTPAQVAGLAALGVEGYPERTREYVARERERLVAALEESGMRVIPSEANYLLFKSPIELYGPLLDRGILIRRCANFEGLDESWFRIAVRTHGENERLVSALGEVVEAVGSGLDPRTVE